VTSSIGTELAGGKGASPHDEKVTIHCAIPYHTIENDYCGVDR
jgi:hypothetical protein